MTCLHHYGLIQSVFTALKSPPPSILATAGSAVASLSSAFSRTSRCRNPAAETGVGGCVPSQTGFFDLAMCS